MEPECLSFHLAGDAPANPVLMLHGAADPHPGGMIRTSLLQYIPQLEYREWGTCGHYPWLEQDVREAFLTELRAWLDRPEPDGGVESPS